MNELLVFWGCPRACSPPEAGELGGLVGWGIVRELKLTAASNYFVLMLNLEVEKRRPHSVITHKRMIEPEPARHRFIYAEASVPLII